MQAVQGLLGFIALAFVIACLPETMRLGTRGIDTSNAMDLKEKRATRLVFLNPLSPLWLMKSPILLMTVRLPSFIAG